MFQYGDINQHVSSRVETVVLLSQQNIPNIIWTKYLPEGYEEIAKNENKILLALERIGEVLTSVLVLIFSDFNPRKTIWVAQVI
jgi:hypothetical protein